MDPAELNRRGFKAYTPWTVDVDGRHRKAAPEQWDSPIFWNRRARLGSSREKVVVGLNADFFEDYDGTVEAYNGQTLHLDQQGSFGFSGRPASLSDVREAALKMMTDQKNIDWVIVTKLPADQAYGLLPKAARDNVRIMSPTEFTEPPKDTE